MNTLIISHAPSKKLNKKQRKFQQKPWITKVIQNAIEKKNRLFNKFIKCGDSNKKIFHQEYNTYRNSLSTLLKQSKKIYYNNHFRNSINNIKSNWKGIKSTISLNTKESESPKIILNNMGEFITNPNDIANQFNKFFCSIAPTIQSNIKPDCKYLYQYLTEPCKESLLISSCTKNEILEIIPSVDYNRSVGITSIPIKILKLAKEQVTDTSYITYFLQQVFFQTV